MELFDNKKNKTKQTKGHENARLNERLYCMVMVGKYISDKVNLILVLNGLT